MIPTVIAVVFDRVWDTSTMEIHYSDGSKRTISVEEGDTWEDAFLVEEEPNDDAY